MPDNQRTTKNTPSSTPRSGTDADLRRAEQEANDNARMQAAQQGGSPRGSDIGFVAPVAGVTEVGQSHTSTERPADAGYVGGSPEDLQRRLGDTKAGVSDAEMVSNEGVPDLPAIERHNQHFREVAEATANEARAAGNVQAGQAAVLGTPETGANKSNVIEGNLPDAEGEAPKKG